MEEPLLAVASLHALTYCERLFYLEEVEHIRVADAAVFAGRRVHVELSRDEVEEGDWSALTLESAKLGLRGVVDVLKRRDGRLIPYEHKRGRSAGKPGAREAWRTDRVQAGAYALLVEEASGGAVEEVRLRYHADGVVVRVAADAGLRAEVAQAVERARALRNTLERPPVAPNERLCVRCSLAPVCLPEEARLAQDASFTPIRLLPPHPGRRVLHVLEAGASVGRSGDELALRGRERTTEERMPIAEIGSVVIHGLAQITTQALRLCVEHEVGVHWMTAAGQLTASLAPSAPTAQRHLRQMRALEDPARCLELARRLVLAKVEGQLRFALRATRESERPPEVDARLEELRAMLRRIAHAAAREELLGLEGNAAAAYFGLWPALIAGDLDPRFQFGGRSRRPPRDRVNCLLGYGYGMLYREVLAGIVGVGLHPGLGFYHQLRSAAHPLALDVMEVFRVPLVDMALLAALNRHSFDAGADFVEAPGQVLLSDAGRRKAIEVFERRKADTWRHSVVGYSLSYARMIELEVRLLEKEWLGEGGIFARFRLR